MILSYIMYASTHSYSYVHVCLYLFISLYIIYAFLSRFSYSCIFYIYIMYTSIHSCIHIYIPSLMYFYHIYSYPSSNHIFISCIPKNFNQAISTLGTTFQFFFQNFRGHQMPLNNMWSNSRLKGISIESKNTQTGVRKKKL